MYSRFSKYYKIGGHLSTIRPPILPAITQTDASFWLNNKRTSLGVIMNLPDSTIIHKSKILYTAGCSTEAEWEAVLYGLEETLEQGSTNLCLENDNLSVVAALLDRAQLRKRYARENYEKIKKLCNYADFVGIRWIPREMNLADQVARNAALRTPFKSN